MKCPLLPLHLPLHRWAGGARRKSRALPPQWIASAVLSLFLARGPKALPVTPREDLRSCCPGALWQPPPPPWSPPASGHLVGVLVRRRRGASPAQAQAQARWRVSPAAGSAGRVRPPLSPPLLAGLHLSTSEKVFRFQDAGLLLRVLGSLFLGGVLAFGLGFSEFLLVSRTSSLTLSIAGIFKVQTQR